MVVRSQAALRVGRLLSIRLSLELARTAMSAALEAQLGRERERGREQAREAKRARGSSEAVREVRGLQKGAPRDKQADGSGRRRRWRLRRGGWLRSPGRAATVARTLAEVKGAALSHEGQISRR